MMPIMIPNKLNITPENIKLPLTKKVAETRKTLQKIHKWNNKVTIPAKLIPKII